MAMASATEFRKALEALINQNSLEGESNTPDFILAEYLATCLAAFDAATNARDRWMGIQKRYPPFDIHDGNS